MTARPAGDRSSAPIGRPPGATHAVSSDLAKAEALFKGFKQKKKDEAEALANPEAAAERAAEAAAAAAAAPPEKARRRVRIRDVSAIRPAAAEPIVQRPAPDAPVDDGFRRQISDTLKQLGRDGAPRPAQVAAAAAGSEPALRASVAPAVVNAFQITISAPSVKADGPLQFVIEGDDIAQVASDALVRVAEYMGEHHPGAAWKMQSLERIPLALVPRR